MVAAAIFKLNPCARFRLNSFNLHRIGNIPTKFGENYGQIIKELQQFFAIQDGGSRHLDSWWIRVSWWYSAFHQIRNMRTKFSAHWPNFEEMATPFRNSRWRRPPSCILVNMPFWYDSCVLCQILNLPTKLCRYWSNSKDMATDCRHSRWRRPPSWKIHFRLNRHYEKGTPGLLLPIEKDRKSVV